MSASDKVSGDLKPDNLAMPGSEVTVGITANVQSDGENIAANIDLRKSSTEDLKSEEEVKRNSGEGKGEAEEACMQESSETGGSYSPSANSEPDPGTDNSDNSDVPTTDPDLESRKSPSAATLLASFESDDSDDADVCTPEQEAENAEPLVESPPLQSMQQPSEVGESSPSALIRGQTHGSDSSGDTEPSTSATLSKDSDSSAESQPLPSSETVKYSSSAAATSEVAPKGDHISNSGDTCTPVWKSEGIESPMATPSRKRLRRNSKSEGLELELNLPPAGINSPRAEIAKAPDWLPEGWTMEERVRESGATAGVKDKYYYDGEKNKFRSKKEILCFLETGTTKGGSKTVDASQGNTSGSGSKGKIGTASNFDFTNVPKKVSWVLHDSVIGSFTPYIGDEKVNETSKQEWAAAFTSMILRNSGTKK